MCVWMTWTEKPLPRRNTCLYLQFVTKEVIANLADGCNKVRSAQLYITNRRGLSCVSGNFWQLMRSS